MLAFPFPSVLQSTVIYREVAHNSGDCVNRSLWTDTTPEAEKQLTEQASKLTANMTATDAMLAHMSVETSLLTSCPAGYAHFCLTHWDLFHTFRYVRRHVSHDARRPPRRGNLAILFFNKRGSDHRCCQPNFLHQPCRSSEKEVASVLFPFGMFDSADWPVSTRHTNTQIRLVASVVNQVVGALNCASSCQMHPRKTHFL